MAIAFGGGRLKQNHFNDFIDSLEPTKKKIDVNKSLKQLKQSGFKIEEK